MTSPQHHAPLDNLSQRAIEILHLLAEGLSDREIADRLVLTVNTVKWYNRQIYSILDVGNRTQAVVRARALHLLKQDESVKHASYPIANLLKHNIPADTTHFIGRKREISVVKRLLQASRLLTLTGAPGTGKTRLSLQVGRDLINDFHDGVYVVSLAPIHNPTLVANAIATELGINEIHSEPIQETLIRILRIKQLLLIIDNFEHLLEGASIVSDLLSATEQVKIITTSREPLRIYGEQEYKVPLMELPNPEYLNPTTLSKCESVALFMVRASAVQPDFELTKENALDIAKICVRLEGLPLAIELAAARIKLLTPKALLNRLASQLQVLVRGPRDLPPRQQTLRHTIDWSYALLTDEEKQLFSRLSVFRGGRSLEAIEAVCHQGLAHDSLEVLESLLNKSLLFQQAGRDEEPRFIMLETIHEYACEQLLADGEADVICRYHAQYFLDIAEHAEYELRRADSSYWMARLEVEHENLRVALEWSLGGGDIELGLKLVASLRDYWVMSSSYIEGEQWTQQALAKSEQTSPSLRSRLLTTAGYILFTSVEPLRGRQLLEEAVPLARSANDKLSLAWALTFLGSACIGQASVYEKGLSVTEESLELFRELRHKPGIAQALNIIGELTRTNGYDERAEAVYEECLQLVQETGELRRESMILSNLGIIATKQNDIQRAHSLFIESFIKALKLGYDTHWIISLISSLAGVIGAGGDLKKATHLFGASEALLEPIGAQLQPGDQPAYDRDLALLRSQLEESTFDAWWKEGRTMSLERAIDTILDRQD